MMCITWNFHATIIKGSGNVFNETACIKVKWGDVFFPHWARGITSWLWFLEIVVRWSKLCLQSRKYEYVQKHQQRTIPASAVHLLPAPKHVSFSPVKTFRGRGAATLLTWLHPATVIHPTILQPHRFDNPKCYPCVSSQTWNKKDFLHFCPETWTP